MGTTPEFGFPYPENSDPSNGPAQFKALAEAVEDQLTGPQKAESYNTDSTVRSAFLKTTSATQHAATIYQASTTGRDVAVALNVISDNRESSAMYLTGHETLPRGTLKVTHVNGSTTATGDTGAAAISVDLQQGDAPGTAATGIYVTATDGPTSGNLLLLRNNGRDDFVVKATGRTGIGMAVGENPEAALEVRAPDTATPAIAVTGVAGGAESIMVKDSAGAPRFEVDANGATVHRAVAFFTGAVQLGSTSLDTGGAGGSVISMKNVTTAPTSNPTGGGILFVQNGRLLYRGDQGTVTEIAPA